MSIALELLSAATTGDFGPAKIFIGRFFGVSHDALHVIAGFLLHLFLAALFRSSIAKFWPWGVVLLAELANELNDLRFTRLPSLSEQLGEGAKDLALTMLLPTILLLGTRFSPQMFKRRR